MIGLPSTDLMHGQPIRSAQCPQAACACRNQCNPDSCSVLRGCAWQHFRQAATVCCCLHLRYAEGKIVGGCSKQSSCPDNSTPPLQGRCKISPLMQILLCLPQPQTHPLRRLRLHTRRLMRNCNATRTGRTRRQQPQPLWLTTVRGWQGAPGGHSCGWTSNQRWPLGTLPAKQRRLRAALLPARFQSRRKLPCR